MDAAVDRIAPGNGTSGALHVPAALQGMAVHAIETAIVDCPTTRRHKLSNTEISAQSYVIVRMVLKNGAIGYGEASTLGGPRWAEESVESIKSVIDTYLAPTLMGLDALAFEQAALRMGRAASRNFAAKAALESALYDAAGHALGLPAAAFLGGRVRDDIEIVWALASGDAQQEIDEARQKLDARQHRHFKIKLGFHDPATDMARVARIVEAVGDRSRIIVDVNQAWSEATAIRHVPGLAEMGVALIEQPLAGEQSAAMARLATRSHVPLLLDEGAFTNAELAHAGMNGEGHVYSLKLVKSGGLQNMKRAAGIASALGMELYGGCLIESGIGAAAHLAVFSTLPKLEWGTEQFGPKILVTDLVKSGIEYREFKVSCPQGPGLGIEVDEEALKRFSR